MLVVSQMVRIEIESKADHCEISIGGLLGAYATTNGANRTVQTYISRWRYTPVGQEVDYGDFIYAT
jgi:hypothetical protein